MDKEFNYNENNENNKKIEYVPGYVKKGIATILVVAVIGTAAFGIKDYLENNKNEDIVSIDESDIKYIVVSDALNQRNYKLLTDLVNNASGSLTERQIYEIANKIFDEEKFNEFLVEWMYFKETGEMYTYYHDKYDNKVLITPENNIGYINPAEITNLPILYEEDEEFREIDVEKEAMNLFNEVNSKKVMNLQYQQECRVVWDEATALNVVEYINGKYPSNFECLSDYEKEEEEMLLQNTISMLIAGNLYSVTKEEDMVNLSCYVANPKARVVMNNALAVARNCVNESIGEPCNGKIIDDVLEVNKFSDKYKTAAGIALNYEYETIHDNEFSGLKPAQRFVITNIFQQCNNGVMPQDAFIRRESSENDRREFDLYYMYFVDEVTKEMYLPRVSTNAAVHFIKTYYDENGKCHEDIVSLDEMYAMIGVSIRPNEKPDPSLRNVNIHKQGIGNEVDIANQTSLEQLENLRNYSKTK